MKNSSWLFISFPISLKPTGDSAVVVGLTGKATYHPDSGDNLAIQEGAVLGTKGEVQLGPDSELILFHNGRRHNLGTEGRHDLSRILQSGGGTMKLKKGFARKFEKELMMAFAITSPTSGPTPSPSPSPNNPSDEDDKGDPIGWGKRSIIAVTPVDTTVGEEEVLFLWKDLMGPDDAIYTFQLFRLGGETPILQAQLKKKEFTVDLAAFKPREGEVFFWIVSAGDKQSEKAHFTYSEEKEKVSEILRKVRSEEVYQEAGETEKLLMEAVALKEEGLLHQAIRKLRKASADKPDSALIRGMMRNFVSQMR